MGVVEGGEFGARLCEKLGIDGTLVRSVTLVCKPDEVLHVVIEREVSADEAEAILAELDGADVPAVERHFTPVTMHPKLLTIQAIEPVTGFVESMMGAPMAADPEDDEDDDDDPDTPVYVEKADGKH